MSTDSGSLNACQSQSPKFAVACLRTFTYALLAALLLAAITTQALVWTQGESIREAASATAPWQVQGLRYAGGDDSWTPMLTAYLVHERDGEPLYRVFFEDKIKFQYPPTSLLVFVLLPTSFTRDPSALRANSELHGLLDTLSRTAVALTLLFTALAVRAAIRRHAGKDSLTPSGDALLFGLIFGLGLIYFPLMRAYQLGQIQIFLDCLIALSAWLLVRGASFPAGFCIGLCCLVKPQYALVLIWSVLQRDWKITLGMCAAGGAALALSLAKFGLENHLAYLEVLQSIARQGETYWANQSFNGLMNRYFGNGDATRFDSSEFAPYHPIVHATTLLTSIILIVIALWSRPGATTAWRSRMNGYGLALTAATIASPIAWEHHYGALFPVLLLTVPALIESRPLGRWTVAAWTLSYCAMGGIALRPQLIHGELGLNFLGTHILLGGLLVFFLLCLLRSSYRRGQLAQP